MAAPYLLEIRPGGGVKQRLREITYDVADTFGVRGAVDPRPVPHITLFGPYNTNNGHRAKRITQSVLKEYDLAPYRIDGFGRFPENKVIYANVVPSPELRQLRRELSRKLRRISYNYQPWDSEYFYDYHITIAFKDTGNQFSDVWRYVNREYSPRFDEYATRVTALRQRSMMWEWDLPQSRELRPHEATSASSWERTNSILHERASSGDHGDLAPKPTPPTRVGKLLVSKLRGRW